MYLFGPGQPEQQGFCLICNSMGRGHPVYPFPAKPFKTGIAEIAGSRLPAIGQGQALLPCPEHPQLHPQPGALVPDKGFICVGRRAPQPVVHMAGGDGDPQRFRQSQKHPQQGHAVGPARHGRRHLLSMHKKPGLPTMGKHPGLGCLEDFGVVLAHISAGNPHP